MSAQIDAATSTVTGLYRYPVKGLSPEPADRFDPLAGNGIPYDRSFAFALGTTEFDSVRPAPLPKSKFLMLMRDEGLAALRTKFEPATGVFHVRHGDQKLDFDFMTDDGRKRAEDFFTDYAGDAAKGRVRLVSAPDHRFTDIGAPVPAMMNCVSLINLASMRALGDVMGRTLNPLRFRANIYIDGLEPWIEFSWMDQEIPLGGLRFRVVRRTRRCPATNVDPVTAERDADIPAVLRQQFGHGDLGVYLEALTSGLLAVGDAVEKPSRLINPIK